MEKKLSEMLVGETGTIVNVGGEGKIRRRLFDMGVTPGAIVYLRKLAPLGDPIEINIRNYELSLRKAEAAYVTIDLKGKGPQVVSKDKTGENK
jgi:ferrous iron transport protein A